MLSGIFIIMFVLIVWHLLYESIIAPTLRLLLKINYEKLEDALFIIKIKQQEKFNSDTFKLLESEIIYGRSCINILNIISAKNRYDLAKNYTKIEELLDQRDKIINNCKLYEVKELERNIINNFIKTITINSGGWMIYMVIIGVPIIILLSLLSLVNKSIITTYIYYKESLKKKIIILILSYKKEISSWDREFHGNRNSPASFIPLK